MEIFFLTGNLHERIFFTGQKNCFYPVSET